MPADPEADVLSLVRSGRVVAMDGLVEWDVSEVHGDPATLWFRLQRRDKENEHPDERRYLKVGLATEAELQHVRRARGGQCKLVLHTVQARDVLRAAAAQREGKVFVKVGREVA